MITVYDAHGVTWVNLEKPSRDEIIGLEEKYNIHPVVLNELSGPSLRTKVDLYPQYVYMIFRFPALTSNHDDVHETEEREVDFIIGKDFIITTHYTPIDPLFTMGKYLETGALLNKEKKIEHAGFLFYAMMRRLYQATEDDLIHLRQHIMKVEAGIFAGEERKMVEDISRLKSVLINFWWCTRAHGQLLSSFEIIAKSFWGETFHYYMHSLNGEFAKIDRMIEGYKEVISGLQDTNDSLLTAKSDQTMKVLTMPATIIFAISAIGTIFSMNVENTPLVKDPNAFWYILGVMFLISVASMAYFWYKKWI